MLRKNYVFSKVFIATKFVVATVLFFGSSSFAPWIHLDCVDPSEKQAILKRDVFSDPTFFPPLYQAAYDLQQLFEIGGVKAIANFGTALGIARFGQSLPWDDDIDYVVTIDQIDKLNALIPLADKLGYDLFPDDVVRYGVPGDASVGYKLYRREPFFVDPETKQEHWVFVDIFLFQPDEQDSEKYIATREKFRKSFPKSWMTREEFEERTELQCGPIKKMPCSKHMQRMLYRMYDKDCEKTARFYFSHHHDVKTCYDWTIKPEDDYPSHKDIKLESRVEKLLSGMSFAELKESACKEKQLLLEDEKKPVEEVVSALLGDSL
ncbi:MAG: LicD family protein [Proteobacteria bacterium]|nr:LicD family protein [Pseudomonadota bacterium]